MTAHPVFPALLRALLQGVFNYEAKVLDTGAEGIFCFRLPFGSREQSDINSRVSKWRRRHQLLLGPGSEGLGLNIDD